MSKFDRLKKDPAPSAEATPSRSQLESSFIRVTGEYAKQDEIEKAAKKKKEKLRGEFMNLANTAVIFDGLDRKTEVVPDYVGGEDGRFDVHEWVARDHPGWQVVEEIMVPVREHDHLMPAVVIEQIASEVPFSYVNNVDRVVLSRQISYVKSGIDVDWLWEEYPEIAGQVTREVLTMEFDEEQAVLYMSDHPESQSVFEKVVFPGTPQVKMAAPKKLKDEE